ncbi:MAG: hypothetical protein ACR2IV_05915 [Bryobacteraceae bacterium]
MANSVVIGRPFGHLLLPEHDEPEGSKIAEDAGSSRSRTVISHL